MLSEGSSSSFAKTATDDGDGTQSKFITAQSSSTNQQDFVNGILENNSHASISVSSDWSVNVAVEQKLEGDGPSQSALTDGDVVLRISSSFLLIRKLHHRKVDMCDVLPASLFSFLISFWSSEKSVQALHVVESSHLTIFVREPIQSAVHITSFQHVQLTAVAQQLRLHESTDLTRRVQLHAGAILEDCTRVVFFVEKETDVDVEDFLIGRGRGSQVSILPYKSSN